MEKNISNPRFEAVKNISNPKFEIVSCLILCAPSALSASAAVSSLNRPPVKRELLWSDKNETGAAATSRAHTHRRRRCPN
jgi:hypothetical protein